MQYLISEVEVYVPTLDQFKKNVVVVRRDQLEGEKIYIAPKELVGVVGRFGSENNSVAFPHFADIILFLKATNSNFNYQSDINMVTIITENDPIYLSSVDGEKVIMEVSEFLNEARSLYDFLTSLGVHVLVASNLPRVIENDTEQPKAPLQEPHQDEQVPEDKVEPTGRVSGEEMEAVIADSKEEAHREGKK